MLLFMEAHLEYNAGLVISIGSANRPSPTEPTSVAEHLAEELEDYRQQLLAMAAPPDCPTEASQGGVPVHPAHWSANGKLARLGGSVGIVWHLYALSILACAERRARGQCPAKSGCDQMA